MIGMAGPCHVSTFNGIGAAANPAKHLNAGPGAWKEFLSLSTFPIHDKFNNRSYLVH
jgi:hypothetical protein